MSDNSCANSCANTSENVPENSGENSIEASKLVPTLEAILFAAGYPVSFEKLAEVMSCTKDDIKSAARELGETLAGHGIELLIFDESCQLCTKGEYIDKIRDALGVKRGGNLSRSSMETLAIIAYHQPVTRSYVEQIRGMDSSYAVNNLCDKKLIEVCGRLDAPGHPSLYRTTEDFLRVFGISSLDELPEAMPSAAVAVVPSEAEAASPEESKPEEN